LREAEPLRRHTTVRTGGEAALMAFPRTGAELERLCGYLRRREVPCFFLSGGSKVLFPDEGFPGVVVNLRTLRGLRELSPGRVEVLCGTPVAALIAYGLRKGYGGAEFLAGIPATVGGAVRMNAGAFGECMGDLVEEILILKEEGFVRWEASPGTFGYRSFRGPEGVILSAVVRLRPLGREGVRRRIERFLAARRSGQPFGVPSFGCAFRNPGEGPPAGWLIERVGLKGRSRGGAVVSPRHANFIVNTGRAASRDILDLMEEARERVHQRFGILLEPEVRIVGRA